MADNKRVTFGRVSAWEVDEEKYEAHGITNKMTVTVSEEQAQQLIDYLDNEANKGNYGFEFEITLFEADADKSFIASGSLQPKFKKQQQDEPKRSGGRSGGRRSL